ncbi:MAG: hypothetical protein AAFV51_10860 [Pseudomonadota bacterium]
MNTPPTPSSDDVVTLRIDAVGAQGDGVARGADGAAVYVPYSAPADIAEVRLQEGRGRLMRVVKPGPDRADPVCRHFGVCGGCAVQHLNDAAYAAWKREMVAAALRSRGLEADVEAPVRSPLASRRRAVFTARRVKVGWRIGFKERGSRELAALSECPVMRPAIAAFLRKAPDLLSALPADIRAAALHATQTEEGLDVSLDKTGLEPLSRAAGALIGAAQALDLARLSLDGDPVVAFRTPTVRMGRARVAPPPRAFLQATAEGEAALVDLAREGLGDAARIADLFCGVGSFALPLAENASVYAADSERPAIDALKAAAGAAGGLKPITAERRDLFRRPLEAAALDAFGAVLFDPPRAGAAAQAERIAASSVRRVVAISCNAATFARDARTLVDGGYALTRIACVDQFLFAAHIELVGFFERR